MLFVNKKRHNNNNNNNIYKGTNKICRFSKTEFKKVDSLVSNKQHFLRSYFQAASISKLVIDLLKHNTYVLHSPNKSLPGGRVLASFSALFASLTTRVYKYYLLMSVTNKYLAASHLELGLAGFILLNLDHYTNYPKQRLKLEASFLLAAVMNSRTSLISLGYTDR